MSDLYGDHAWLYDAAFSWDVEDETDWNARLAHEETHFEVLTGPEAGARYAFELATRLWDWAAWQELIAQSPFEQVAAWDGDQETRPALPRDRGLEQARLTWHELVVPAE